MKFQCQNPECKKIFVYAAKRTSTEYNPNYSVKDLLETHECPFCKSPNFEEYAEPKVIEKISSVKSVELVEVDEWIAQGYEVKELYAKTATMIKKEKTC
jgi:hypothetical protein